ncbi:AraC family transcriptional regulator [Wenjunlia tyrosinilytica]|uniref:AraC family transcriptional regulator n=1 Tax=Wenjunlia tyrosinilytica TaxID=1544741 RepID=A0A917ZSP6_9ACTN|nr:AraC family transcriptional regulator [Wenjunlia tyrosinilytica]GGO91868.1 AraC family transcriptional regulator [Wenjunlia tyrosinilytica]
MDVFSDVIATMRVGRAKFTRSRRSGAWGSRFGPYPGAGFHIVLRGSCWLLPADDSARLLTSGDVVFLPHGTMHGMSDSADRAAADLPLDVQPGQVGDLPGDMTDELTHDDTLLLCGAYRLDRGRAHPFLHALPDIVHLPARPGHHPALRTAVDLLATELTDPRRGADATLPALLDLLLVYLLRAWMDEESARRPSTGWLAALTDPAVAAALNHLHRDPARPWTVQDLSNEVGMSRTAFAKRFTSFVGQPPMAYLTWWRLSTAARILSAGDSPLATVAQQVGYTSEFAFSNAFKRTFGVAPGRFRREHRAAGAHSAGAR